MKSILKHLKVWPQALTWRQRLLLTPTYVCLCLQPYAFLFVLCVHECSEGGGQKEVLDSIELGLWMIVSCPTWMLGDQIWTTKQSLKFLFVSFIFVQLHRLKQGHYTKSTNSLY